MARRKITIDEKIDRQKQVVSKIKAKYEEELKVLDKLMEIRDAELDKELLAAFRKSGLSHQDVINLMAKGRSDDEDESSESYFSGSSQLPFMPGSRRKNASPGPV